MKPHELDDRIRRRTALGILGGAIATAVGLAPHYHRQATLPVTVRPDLDTIEFETIDEPDRLGATALDLVLDNHGDERVDPLISTWDQKRHTRHNWEIELGPSFLDPGQSARYRIAAPGDEAILHPGLPAQVTVFETGVEQWTSAGFRVPTPEVDP